MLECPQRAMQSLPPKISAGDASGTWYLAALGVTSSSPKGIPRERLPSARREPCMETPLWRHFLDYTFPSVQKGEVVLKQFSVFSRLCFAQHPMALKPKEKSEKGSSSFLSNPFCYPPVPYPFLFIASLQRRDFRSITRC